MCMLRDPDTKSRIEHNQLLAVRHASSAVFHVGIAQWLRARENNPLLVGVRLFPGVIVPDRARSADSTSLHPGYELRSHPFESHPYPLLPFGLAPRSGMMLVP
jgi:hypothetical protein